MRWRRLTQLLLTVLLLETLIFVSLVVYSQPTYSVDTESDGPVIYDAPSTRMYEWPPLYYQFNERWADVPYAGGTIKSSGCGLTVFASALSYVTQSEILPDTLAATVGDACLSGGVNDIGKFLDFFQPIYDLTYGDIFFLPQDAREHLRQGDLVFAGVRGNIGKQTYEGHIVLMWEAYGYINVLDPACDTLGGLTEKEFNTAGFIYFYWLDAPEFG